MSLPLRASAPSVFYCLLVFLVNSLLAIQSSGSDLSLVFDRRSEYHDSPVAREPMIVQHPNGTLFVTGYGGGHPNLWRSTDRGVTWSRVNLGTADNGVIGDSDVDLAVARDGTLYFINLSYDRKADEGTLIAVAVSRDAGATWKWKTLSIKRYDDRPWVAVAPDGTAHAIWNDGDGVLHTSSNDHGQTWSQPARISDRGGSSHLAVGPNGEVAVRVTPWSASGFQFDPGVDFVAISTDSGRSWQKRPMPGNRDWGSLLDPKPGKLDGATPRWVEPVAWGPSGALYAFWTEKNGGWLGYSEDQGRNWKMWHVVSSTQLMYFPYLTVDSTGELAATWFTGIGNDQHFHVGLIDFDTAGGAPRLTDSGAREAEIWQRQEKPGEAPARDTGGEYLPVIILHGEVAVVTPIQHANREQDGFALWTFKKK